MVKEEIFMNKRLIAFLGAMLLLFSLTIVSNAQVTKVTTVQNPDGTYSIVEYPVGKETVVTLSPVGLTGATGSATILRSADGTSIKVNFASLPNTVAALNLVCRLLLEKKNLAPQALHCTPQRYPSS